MAHVTSPICSTNWSQQDAWTGLPSPLPEPQESIPPGNGRRQDCLSWREWLGCALHSFPALLWIVAWVRLCPLLRLSLGSLRAGSSSASFLVGVPERWPAWEEMLLLLLSWRSSVRAEMVLGLVGARERVREHLPLLHDESSEDSGCHERSPSIPGGAKTTVHRKS